MASTARPDLLNAEVVLPRRSAIPWRVMGVALLVVAGSVALYPMWADSWTLWSEDPLRSIGAVFPAISITLVIWRWRSIGYRGEGSFWGLGLVTLAIFGARLFNASKLSVVVAGSRWGLLHPGMVLFCYGVGCVLLFGGVALFRKTIFPLCLLFLLNPVPHIFNTAVDLPLQQLGANTARAFSHLIGLQPTGEQLKMMFAPDFGMMIVPGCNGVRGAVTLGYLALIFGYTRRLSAKALAVLALGAFLMGYVLNLIRLCTLVIYYRVGLSVTSIQRYGVEIDYVIGCTIFLIATLGIGLGVRFYEAREGLTDDPDTRLAEIDGSARGFGLRAICFAVLAVFFIVPQMQAIAAGNKARPTAEGVQAALPKTVGSYTLERTWTEHESNGRVSFVLGDYASASQGRLTLGLWVGGSNHFVANSRLYQGLKPVWSGSFAGETGTRLPVRFLGNFYDDGVARSFDAETACTAAGCGENLVMDPGTGLVFSSPDLKELALARTTPRLPILLRREWSDESAPADGLRAQFEGDAKNFIAHLPMNDLLTRAGSIDDKP